MPNDTFVMTARQSAELDHAFERNGWSAGDVKWLSQGENLKAFLAVRRGTANIIPMPILKFVDTVTIPARTVRFIPKDAFVVNINPGSHVKIADIDSEFIKWFGEKVGEPTVKTTLRWYVLARPSVFARAMQEVRDDGFVTKTTPGELYSLLEKQPDGPKSDVGPLLTNVYANLFEMDDMNGVHCLVNVYWADGGWNLNADDASDPAAWGDGRQLFSRDSRLPSVA